MSRPRHQDKHIEKAISFAESRGWTVIKSTGHCWGFLYCPQHTRQGCRVTIYSTPEVPENHARKLMRNVAACDHRPENEEGGQHDG